MESFKPTFAYKLIYIFRINDDLHKGLLKIGEATCTSEKSSDALSVNCRELNIAAKNRINQYTQTAGIPYELLHTELAVRTVNKDGKTTVKAFSDHDVHKVLERSGIKHHYFDQKNKANEWFEVDFETAKRAIQAVKAGRASLTSSEISEGIDPIIFRPEQEKAIHDTVAQFKKSDRMLWNAKMRFGKTLTALQVAKLMGFHKTIILTHRPVVNKGWYEDFQKIFYDTDYVYGSKTNGERIENLVDTDKKFVYFASMQDLRGSQAVGGKFDKNDFIFLLDWDFVVVDEAHEGTLTKLGQAVIEELCNQTKKPKVLRLSGTPFNLLDQFKESEIYTWDYVMEQRAKHEWDKLHLGDNNPYAGLPEMQIYTYDLNKLISGYFDDEDQAFNFREFFRTWTGSTEKDFKPIPEGAEVGDFVHEADVNAFLNLMCKSDDESNYPYSKDEYRNYFRHSLWMVPGVKEARALSALLHKHPVFGSGVFNIRNVAGPGDEEVDSRDALAAVQEAFGDNPDETYSITISCGRLTTGVSVPEWTAVFMLAGTFSTSASAYMQTIFRVQTPANINGKVKDRCCVFDFAPDRTLKMVAEAGKLSAKAGNVSNDRVKMGEFLNFCPVIGIEGSKMSPFNVDSLLQQLKRAFTDRVVRNGFDDIHIYNDNLLKLDGIELKEFEELKKIIGASKQTKRQGDIDVNRQGLTDAEYEELERIERIPKKERTPEQIAKFEQKKKQYEQAATARSILRGISIRIPLIVYGADVSFDREITTENFTELIDDTSWEEFMPKGVDKATFRKFSKYYEQDVFVAAGRSIRQQALAADKLSPTERVKKIASIFNTFKNPDKETVLTPWRVVNMHLSDCLGGYDFYDTDHEDILDGEPRFVDKGKVTEETLGNVNAHILEINSKSGLYPLYVTYSIFKKRCSLLPDSELTFEKQWELWKKTVEENIFVICKTSMARAITKRTLLGYHSGKVNAHAFDDLIMQIKEKSEQLIEKITRGSFWGKESAKMVFDAVVGNPPYQEETDNVSQTNGQARRKSIFHYFQIAADKIMAQMSALIYPAGRWIQRSGRGMNEFGLEQLNDRRLARIYYYPNAKELFPTADIGDGISIVTKIRDKQTPGFEYIICQNGTQMKFYMSNPGDDFLPLDPRHISIVAKIDAFAKKYNLSPLHKRIYSQKLFGIESDFVEKNPNDVRVLEEDAVIDFSTEIKLFSNDRAGKGGRAKWYIVNKDRIQSARDLMNKWKVVVSSANAGGQKRDNQLDIFDNHSVFGRVRIALGIFDTENEAKNFYAYMKTYFARFAFLMTDENLSTLGLKVPDLGNYAVSQLVTFDDTLDNQLYTLCDFSSDEREYIMNVVNSIREE